MNEVKLTGAFERGVEMSKIERSGKTLDLAMGSLSYNVKRSDREVTMWIDVECVGDKAQTLADVPQNISVTITGELRRAAWKDKITDEWKHRHFIYYRDHEMIDTYEGEQAPPVAAEDDIPF